MKRIRRYEMKGKNPLKVVLEGKTASGRFAGMDWQQMNKENDYE